jgi:membrane protease YdiL (CAAX protease family)
MWLFLVITYGLAWIWWIYLAVTHSYVYPGIGWPTHLIALMAPSIAAVVVIARESGREGLRRLWKRTTLASFNKVTTFLVVGTAIFAFIPVITDSTISLVDLGKYSGAPSKGLLAILAVLFLNGFGEEIGWRGYVAEKYLSQYSLTRAAGIVWLVWAPWHIPLFFVVDTYRQMGPFMIVGWAVSIYFGSVVLTWLYKYSGGSILVVVAWHIAYNLSVATAASKGFATATISALVIIGAIWILRHDRTSKRG